MASLREPRGGPSDMPLFRTCCYRCAWTAGFRTRIHRQALSRPRNARCQPPQVPHAPGCTPCCNAAIAATPRAEVLQIRSGLQNAGGKRQREVQ